MTRIKERAAHEDNPSHPSMQAVLKDSSTQKTDQHIYGAVVRQLPNSSEKINGQYTHRNGDEVAMKHWRGLLGTGKMLTID